MALREKAEITWISNEYHLGDFGMDGMLLTLWRYDYEIERYGRNGFEDREIKWILGAGV